MLDLDGLQVAYLGVALAHYLDLETGDIIDQPLDDEPPGDSERYLRIPTRTPESELEDRKLFVEKMPPSAMRTQLAETMEDWNAFRGVLTEDRKLERSFFNFKNDQATRAIEAWLRSERIET